jgi:hypothetical protein
VPFLVLEADEQATVFDIDVEDDVAAVRRDAGVRLIPNVGLDGQDAQ